DLVAELPSANHRINRRVIDLARDVPKRHFDCAHSTALARVPTKLFDLAEKAVELQRIFANDAALEKQCISSARAIANFAKSVHALIGINTNDRAGTWAGLHNRRHPHVSNLQPRRTRVRVHRLWISLDGFI